MDFLIDIDTRLFLAINHLNAPSLDQFMKLLSDRWVWVPLYAMIVWVMWRRWSWRRALGLALLAGIVIALTDQACATLLRPLVGRLRPANLNNPLSSVVHIVDGYRGGTNGFPSCHAANCVALLTFFSLFFRRVMWPLVVWAILNCWSRIYLGVHYPGDILVGSLIGALIAAAVYYLALVVHRFSPHSAIPPVTITIKPIGGKKLPSLRSFLLPYSSHTSTILLWLTLGLTVAALACISFFQYFGT